MTTAADWPLTNGRRALRGRSRPETALKPLLISSRGRSGSTMLMAEFARHPEIVVGAAYPYEIRHASSSPWPSRCYPSPASATRGISPTTPNGTGKSAAIPGAPRASQMRRGAALARFFGDSMPRRLRDLFRECAREAYGAIMAHTGKPAARFFAKKTWLTDNTRHGVRDMFGDVRGDRSPARPA